MVDIERRALYNSLRMNWLLDPSTEAEPWQVENYRGLSMSAIFSALGDCGIVLDQQTFASYAAQLDTPEDLADELLQECASDEANDDRAYLLIFELWRRLVPEKLCLSVFCDELDHQIYLYDQAQLESVEPIEDVLANLQVVLDENVDQGVSPEQAFALICNGCANDVEAFLYDFIAEQIDNKNPSYASELLDAFSAYVEEPLWFDLLRARVMAQTDSETANEYVQELVPKIIRKHDFALNLDLLAFMVHAGEEELFVKALKKSRELVEEEIDLQDLLAVCMSFCRCLDRDQDFNELQQILQERSKISAGTPVDPQDEHLKKLCKIVSR